MKRMESNRDRPTQEIDCVVQEPALEEMIGDVRLKDAPLLATWLMIANQIAQKRSAEPESDESTDVATSDIGRLREAAAKIGGEGSRRVTATVLQSLASGRANSKAVCSTTEKAMKLLKDFPPDDEEISILKWLTSEWLSFYEDERNKRLNAGKVARAHSRRSSR